MNKKGINKTLLFAAIFLQICFILSIPIVREMSIRGGKKIIVKTVPVDPRSLFRGDYIILNYEFSRLDLDKIKHEKTRFSRGQRVFVKLLKVGDGWIASQLSKRPIENIADNEIVLAGSVNRWPMRGSIGIAYGIESYFVPEGKGKRIEEGIRDKKVTVELSIDKKGTASVLKIFIDKKEEKFR